jgi:Tfp pilus assembly protein PilX
LIILQKKSLLSVAKNSATKKSKNIYHFLVCNNPFIILLLPKESQNQAAKSKDGGVAMKSVISKINKRRNKGAAFIVAVIFLAIFSALAVSLSSISGTNVQLANNQHKANLAFCAAQSGLDVVRYWLAIEPNTIPIETDLFMKMQAVQSNLKNKFDGVTNITISDVDSSNNTVTIQPVTLDTTTGQKFEAVFNLVDSGKKLQTKITGSCGEARKQIIVDYNVVPNALNSQGVFGYGVATKGTMSMKGQANIDDVNITVKSGVYIEGGGTTGDAFMSTSNTSVAGDVSIADSYATVSVGGSVGGVQGGADHVHIGVPEVDFPTPDPQHFLQYATVQGIDPKKATVLSNIIIEPNTNPTFAKDITINGVLYIKPPNQVHFSGKVTVNGIIAGAGIENGHNGTSGLTFSGQVTSNDVSTLPDSYGALKQETGTFICAPGFQLAFTGQDLNMGGAIAGNGISFSGQAGGMVKNSIINYSKDPDSMTMVGQGTLTFNRSDCSKPAAGFEPQPPDERLDFMADSYSESL